jgi:hypothetical protein
MAVRKLKNGKAPGHSGLRAEHIKELLRQSQRENVNEEDRIGWDQVCYTIQQIFETREIPEEQLRRRSGRYGRVSPLWINRWLPSIELLLKCVCIGVYIDDAIKGKHTVSNTPLHNSDHDSISKKIKHYSLPSQ